VASAVSSLTRSNGPVPEPWATRLEPAELHALAETIRALTGLRVEEFP
jgi:hypothetical protein